ncbi:unnamed protein product [Soboliphyme baturini]|uniref:Activin_recp domain-containing protein n=1 Tax=Soboliphyme baturini TaxID=241478 RepID=A0A183J3W9_9BILA|nr:unnamed protein product [Soboliphyme baturini]
MAEMLLLISMLLVHVPFADPVKCFSCDGLHCVGALCEGTACVIAKYVPIWGTASLGNAVYTKGCVSGTLMKDNIQDHCDTSSENSDDIYMCICSSDFCNANMVSQKRKMATLVSCVCRGPHCKDSDECIGHYCTYVTDKQSNTVTRGCANYSTPLVERKGDGSCIQPPLTGATVHGKDIGNAVNIESCLCSRDNCNRHKPSMLDSKRRTCRTRMQLSWNGLQTQQKDGTCTGDNCFHVAVNATDSQTFYYAEGCVSFTQDAKVLQELNEYGCLRYETSSVTIDTCFNRAGKGRDPDEPAEQVIALSPIIAAKAATKQTTTATPFEQEAKEETAEENEPEKDDEENEDTTDVMIISTEEENQNETVTQGNEPYGTPASGDEFPTHTAEEKEELYDETAVTEEPEVSVNDNTALVVAFVVIMIIIAVGGLAWKCNLRDKLFHAHYQSVSR